MKVAALLLVALLAVASAGRAEETDSPHHMVTSDGKPDMDKCGTCHEADMSLSRSKGETCTLCHGETPHSGAFQHLHASAADVTRLLGSAQTEKPALPLAEDGGIFCGTCHLFHDPHLSDDKPLPTRRLPPAKGVDKAVQAAVAAQWEGVARKYEQASPGAKFATDATKSLRLQVDDGTLCQRCHGSGGR